VQPEAQQPSLAVQVVMRVSFTHSALQVEAAPISLRFWQPTAGQVVGQLPSHFSPASTTPFPHLAVQSLSLVVLQVGGQQPSPCAQAVWVPSATQTAVQLAAAPVSFRRAQAIQGQVVGQLEVGSQVSPLSTAPLLHFGMQSLSLVALQPAGQQPSPFMHAVCILSSTHWAWQPPPFTSLRSWQPMDGQAVGQLDSGSQVSPQVDSTVPLPQVQLQSLSLAAVHPPGQQLSPEAQVICLPASTHLAVQVSGAPSSFCRVQPMAGHLVGQLEGGSQVSPVSMAPFPHEAWQSLSLAALQPGGQQPSPPRQAVCS